MKNEFKSGYTYITKDGRAMLCISILDTIMLMQSSDGITHEYDLDGTARAVNGINGKHSEHLDLVPNFFSKQDALKEMGFGKRVQSTEWLDENGGKYWFYKKNNHGQIVNEVGDVVNDEFDELSDDICWQICDSFMEPEALENLVLENKNMADFLESLGYTQEQIFTIAFCGEKPKTKIDLLKEEVAEMEKQPMANANAIARFNQKNKSLQNADIAKMAMKKIETSCKQNAMDDIYSSFPENIKTDELWDKIMFNEEFEHKDLVVCELYENHGLDDIREELQVLFNGGKRLAIEAINMVKLPAPNTLSLYKTSVHALSEDVIAMLDGESDYVATGLGRGSMIFDLTTLKNILSSYEEEIGDEEAPDIGSDTSHQEFSTLIDKVAKHGCNGLFLTT